MAVLLTLFVLWCGRADSRAQKPATDQPPTDAAVRVIRQHYDEINAKSAKYRKVKKDISGFSTEGGTFTAYFDGDALAKIKLIYYGESGEAAEEYYYWDGQLIFIYRTESGYGRLRSGQFSSKIVRTGKSRFYFRDNKLIVWLDEDGNKVSPEAGPYQAKQKEYLQDSSEFNQAARSPGTTVEATR